MKPEQGTGGLGRNLRQTIMSSDMGQLVRQHEIKLVPLPPPGLFRQNNLGMENAPCKRGSALWADPERDSASDMKAAPAILQNHICQTCPQRSEERRVGKECIA